MSSNANYIKTHSFPGVDKSIVDFEYAHSAPIITTKIVKPLYKKGLKSFIGIAVLVSKGEVIEAGDFKQKYRVVSNPKYLPKGGCLVQVKRTDGFNITTVDMDSTHVGGKVRIVSRRSFRQKFDQAIEILHKNT